jgi:hypothetical protein
MPLKPIGPAVSPDHDRLVDALADEWRRPTDAPTAPTILEQSQAVGQTSHVYVVWDAWASVPRAERQEIVMDAAERVKSLEDLMRITQAWALLPHEAHGLHLSWR